MKFASLPVANLISPSTSCSTKGRTSRIARLPVTGAVGVVNDPSAFMAVILLFASAHAIAASNVHESVNYMEN